MCQKRNSVLWNGKRVDSCMRQKLIRFANFGMKTLACCCGHGVYPETIVIQNYDGEPFEFNSNTKIPRKKYFYKKDGKGFYFIPEVPMKESGEN